MSTRTHAQSSALDCTTVRETMHAGVVTCAFETPLTEVARLMADNRIHCVVGFGDVAEDDTRLWGVVTDSDLLAVAATADPEDFTAASAAATEPVTIAADQSVRRAAELLNEHQVSHLLVLEGGDRPVGIISGLDVMRVVAGSGSMRKWDGSRVADLMTSPAVTVSPKTPLREVAALLVELGVSGVPVVHDGEVVGVVSEADIVEKEQASGVPKRSGHSLRRRHREVSARMRTARTAGEAMTSPAVTIAAWRPAAAAAALMVEHAIKRLPVVRDGRLVGVVTRTDLVRAFARSDADLERDIRGVVHRAVWLDPGWITVCVVDGDATLTGVVETSFDAELLKSAVERVPGVLSVAADLSVRED